MRTPDAYAVLIKELEAMRRLPAPDLLALVGAPAKVRALDISGEMIELELSVSWLKDTRDAVCIIGHARGPSTWHTEHLQESIIVLIPSGVADGA